MKKQILVALATLALISIGLAPEQAKQTAVAVYCKIVPSDCSPQE